MLISENEFKIKLIEKLKGLKVKSVTGPGRSGAIASVYASYTLRVPFIPYKQPVPNKLRPLLIIDTAVNTGRSLKKSASFYGKHSITLAVFNEPPRLYFWYEKLNDKKNNTDY